MMYKAIYKIKKFAFSFASVKKSMICLRNNDDNIGSVAVNTARTNRNIKTDFPDLNANPKE